MVDRVDNSLHSIVTPNLHSIDDNSINIITNNMTYKDDQIDIINQELVNMICRQTDYSVDEARTQLERFNYDHIKVLNNYYSIDELKPAQTTLSVNQQIYGEIRNLMDAGARQFRSEQERAKKK